LTEWTVDPNDPDKIDPNSAREILRISEPNFHHNTEQLMFNPNAEVGDADYGMLYIAAGDGIVNPPGDPFMEVQDLDNPRGKILRLDPLEQDNGDAYGIPQDNPFLNETGALPYIWATGLRHHQNLVFDTGGQGRMIFNDIGQKQVEEINIGVAGGKKAGPCVRAHSHSPRTVRPIRWTMPSTHCQPTTRATILSIPWHSLTVMKRQRSMASVF